MGITSPVLWLTLSLVAVGVALALATYLLVPFVLRRYRSSAGIGLPSNRRGAVAGVPLLLAPWSLLAQCINPLIPGSMRAVINRQIARAGLDQQLVAAELVAGQLLVAGAGLALCYGLAEVGIPMPAPLVGLLTLAFAWWPWSAITENASRRRRRIGRDLPIFLDLITLAVSAGNTTTAAIAMAVERGPGGPLAQELARMLREIQAGRQRHQAMHDLAERIDGTGLTHAIGAIVAAERQGADLSQVLRAQADQRRHERFLDAEQRAMKAPVKMLLPLVLFIFPGTFLILLYPIALQLLQSGLM